MRRHVSLKKCLFVAPETKCWRDFSRCYVVRLVSTFCIVDREKRPRFGSLLDKSCTSCKYSALHSWDQLFVPCSPLELRYTASEFEGFCSSFNRFLRERASFEHHGCSWTMSVGGFLTFGPVRTDYLTHTWWGGVCGVMQSSGTKRLKFRRALRWLETQQFGRWHENDASLCWSHAWSSNTWDNQTCCLSAFYTLISLFNFHSYPTDLDIIRLILRIFLMSLLLLASV